ncbi:hypothetical protein ABPG74_020686 [Tetrahymena malaccensis]
MKCNDSSTCQTFNVLYASFINGEFQFKVGLYEGISSIQKICLMCLNLCKNCFSKTFCKACVNNLQLRSDGLCGCNDGQYYDSKNYKCIQCNESCGKCSNSSSICDTVQSYRSMYKKMSSLSIVTYEYYYKIFHNQLLNQITFFYSNSGKYTCQCNKGYFPVKSSVANPLLVKNSLIDILIISQIANNVILFVQLVLCQKNANHVSSATIQKDNEYILCQVVIQLSLILNKCLKQLEYFIEQGYIQQLKDIGQINPVIEQNIRSIVFNQYCVGFLLIYIYFSSSIISWVFIQNQQIIGNYIFSTKFNSVWMNSFELKTSYAHHIFTVIPNPFMYNTEKQDELYNFNQFDTIIQVNTLWDNVYNNCFLLLLSLTIIFFLLFVCGVFNKSNRIIIQQIIKFKKCITILNELDYFQDIQYFENENPIEKIEVSHAFKRLFWISFEWKKEQNALIVSTIQPAYDSVYWQLDASGYIQKQVILNGCPSTTQTQDKSFVYQNVLYIFIYNTGNYYTAQFSDIQNALDNSQVQCQQYQGLASLKQFFYKGYYIIIYYKNGLLFIRNNFVLIQSLSDIKIDSNVIINKTIQNFSENDSKCITYYDGQQSYIFWNNTEYIISNGSDYKYYLIDENQQLFFDGKVSIYKFQFVNNQVTKQVQITLDQGSIFSMLFTISGYVIYYFLITYQKCLQQQPNQIIAVYAKQQLQLYDTTTLTFLYSISNSQISISSTSTPYNLILTYQNILIVSENKYTLTYQNSTFQSQVSNINNIYQLPCTDILYRRVFFSTKSQILNDSKNDYFITMDDLVCNPGQYMDSNNQTCVPCPSNCSTCQSTQQCSNCMPGYNLSSGLCKIAYCQTYSSTDQCSQCVQGYTINNGLCILQINNCQTYSSNGQCSVCVSGYKVSNGLCIQSIDNCQTYSTMGQCQTCVIGYTLNSGNICSQLCQDGQFLDNQQQCQPCNQNCKQCSSSTLCLTCNQNYVLNSQKQCVPCGPGQFFDTSSQNCIICIKDMTNNGQCVAQCASNQFYDIVNQQCLNCSAQNQCKPNIPSNNQQYYDQNKMLCISCDKSCLTCQGPFSTDCIHCQNNYVLLQGKCVMNCEIGQYYDDSTQSCQLCNGSNQSQCTNCQLGSFYDKGSKTCLKCDVSCQTCEGTGINQCTSCFQDAIFTNGFCQYCYDGFYYDPKQLSCVQCDTSCKTCKGGSKSDCLSCYTNLNLDLATNQCKMNQSDDLCQNITVYNEDLFNECFQSYKFAQLSSTCLQFLILSSILLSFLLIFISPVSSPVNWCYLQIQQIIGNYIFSPYINILQINHYHLKYSYMHNILNIIPSFFNQNNSNQFNLNLLNTIINVENFSNSYFSDCFYQILIFLVACFISFIFLIKQKFFSKSIKWLDDYINWNFMIGSIRIISNFIIFTFFLFLSSKTSLSQIDYSFFSTFAVIYSLLYFLLFSKLKSTYQYGQSTNLQIVSLASVGTDEILFLSRIFWIGFEFRKLIVITIQGALLLSNDKFKSVPWIHFSINIFYLILIIKYRPFVKKSNNLMLTLMETFHVFLTFFVSIITSTNNQPYTLEYPFLQNNENSQILFGYIFIILMILFVITYLLYCFYIIAKRILQSIRKKSQLKQNRALNISINKQLSISNISKTNSQELIINNLEQNDITWTVNPLKKQLRNFQQQNQYSKQAIELLQQQQL